MNFLSMLMLASFTAPIEIKTDPASFFWLLPICAVIACVYKATKLKKIEPVSFIKDSSLLFATIILFMAIIAVGIYLFVWLIVE